MVAVEIPGYYYDEEKRKYFKVLPSGSAGGASSSTFYTPDRIAKRLKPDHYGNRTHDDHLARRSMPSRTRLADHASLSASLSTGSRRELEARAFAARLARTNTLWHRARLDMVGVTCIDISSPSSPSSPMVWVGNVHGVYKEYDATRFLRESTYQLDITTPFAEFGGQVASISQSGSFRVVTAYTDNDFNAMVCAPSDNASTTSSLPLSSSSSSIWYRIQKFSVPTHAHCSAVSIIPGTHLAIGGAGRLMLYPCSLSNSHSHSHPPLRTFKLKSDLFALQSFQPHAYLAGTRDGAVTVFDSRVARQQQPSLFHASAITKMKLVNDLFLITAGLDDSLSMYDLRFAKSNSASSSSSSMPVITYQGYFNQHTFGHGFDVSNDGSLLAVADQSNKVKLFSVWTGNPLQCQLSTSKFKVIPHALKWMDTFSVNSVTMTDGLLVPNGARLEYWSLG
ncbi:hypothetical protein V1514DRAFT_326974 [Lipomyces japonicus]|uniref:uncharacterized protein n=1 Tax=Lipomyces japonicus TaxID=56871 RepID=UPI0034CFC46D